MADGDQLGDYRVEDGHTIHMVARPERAAAACGRRARFLLRMKQFRSLSLAE